MHVLDKEIIYFPDLNSADEYGLLAIGGDLSPKRLLHAYNNGIFPWYEEGQPILWYAPNPRMVLLFKDLKVSKSMKQLLKKQKFKVTKNKKFREVITNCAQQNRKGQDSTWITQDMIEAYCQLHQLGHATSFEVWENNELVGGLYGIDLKHKKVFCGESMFTKVSNASKVAFIYLAYHYFHKEYKLIDCQVHNDHLESLGCIEIHRDDFINILHH